jgi:CubicO group peptidase (beta-lactamase class C family)
MRTDITQSTTIASALLSQDGAKGRGKKRSPFLAALCIVVRGIDNISKNTQLSIIDGAAFRRERKQLNALQSQRRQKPRWNLQMNSPTAGMFAMLALSGQFAAGQGSVSSPVPPDSEIRKILAERIDKYRTSVGVVVGIIEPQGRRIIAWGHLNQDDPRPLNGDTVFEIDSITKVFTGLLLTDMVVRGEVALTDPVAKYLPDGVKVPQRGGRQITLLDLATHRSGLPDLPLNAPLDETQPIGNYTADQLYSMLAAYRLDSDPGTQYFYSNAGFGLLGHALSRARRAGFFGVDDFSELLEARITGPLGMTDTRIHPTPEMMERFAKGHGYYKMMPAPALDYGVLAGAGGLRSTANDLLKFLAACMGYTKTPLTRAMAAMLETRQPTGELGDEVTPGWHIQTPNRCGPSGCKPMGLEFVVHAGGSNGYASYLAYDRKTRVGVVVLSNASHHPVDVGDIGRHVLNSQFPVLRPKQLELSRRRKEAERQTAAIVDPKMLEMYAGRYQSPADTWAVILEGSRLFMQDETHLNRGYMKYEILPKTGNQFFFLGQDSEVTFDDFRQGRPSGLLLHDEDGSTSRFRRID